MSEKRLYHVYVEQYLDDEYISESGRLGREYVGDTWAISEEKAINNVRYRKLGNVSQYKPIVVGGHWAYGFHWIAEADDPWDIPDAFREKPKWYRVEPKDGKLPFEEDNDG